MACGRCDQGLNVLPFAFGNDARPKEAMSLDPHQASGSGVLNEEYERKVLAGRAMSYKALHPTQVPDRSCFERGGLTFVLYLFF